jgi:hypothetical protein
VNADAAKVVAEASLHEGTGVYVETLARRAQNFVDYRGNVRIVPGPEF